MGRYPASCGCSFISICAMRWMMVAMKKSKMIEKCVWSGEMPKTWKCQPIKAVGNKERSPRRARNASMKKICFNTGTYKNKKPFSFNITFSSKHKKIKIHLTSNKDFSPKPTIVNAIQREEMNKPLTILFHSPLLQEIIFNKLSHREFLKFSLYTCVWLCSGEFVIIEFIQ